MNRLALVIALLGFVCAVPVTKAAVPRDLYAAAVPIEQRTNDPPPEVLQTALAAVLVKLSGRRDIATDPGAAELLASPGTYVQQTGYTAQGMLRVGFDPTSLRAQMLAHGLPVWGDDRPSVLVWLAVDLGGRERSIVGADDQTGVQEALLTVAGERGLPLQLPLLDAEDLSHLQFGDIWGGFDQALRDASERYGADVILIGRASGPALDQLYVNWRLVQGNAVEDWSGALTDGVEHASDLLATRYASVSAGGAQQLQVSIAGIDGGPAYTRILHYLQSMTLVSDVRVERIDGSSAVFTLVTMGEADKLSRQLELSGFLSSDSVGALAYTYRP